MTGIKGGVGYSHEQSTNQSPLQVSNRSLPQPRRLLHLGPRFIRDRLRKHRCFSLAGCGKVCLTSNQGRDCNAHLEMKVTYWKAKALKNHDRYSIRAATEQQANELLAHFGADEYEPLKKITITYSSALELIKDIIGNYKEA